jgi:thioredoxin reductase (NADPH)
VTGSDGATDPGASWLLPREPLPLETNLPGVFAAGDVRCGSVKRCSAAIGEGSMAVALVHRRLAEVGGD